MVATNFQAHVNPNLKVGENERLSFHPGLFPGCLHDGAGRQVSSQGGECVIVLFVEGAGI